MYNNNPNTELTYKTFENIFVNDNMKNLISGNVEDIKKITVDNIFDCYNTFYNPNNMFVIITGNVNPYEALAIIEENQKNKTFNNIIINNKNINEPLKVKEKYKEIEMNVETNKISITYKIPKKNFKKLNLTDELLYLYIKLLFDILFDSTSLIQDKLVSSSIIQNGISINKTYTKDYIIVSLMTDTDYPETLIKMIKEVINNIKIDENDLVRKVKVYKSNYLLHFDDIEAVNSHIQDNILEYGKVLENCMDLYDELNIKKLNEVSKQLKTRSESILIIKPKTTKK